MSGPKGEALSIWIGDSHVGDLIHDPTRTNGTNGIRYTSEIKDTHPHGAICLSASLPVSHEPPTKSATTVDNWLSGLLPEGAALTQLEEREQIQRGDTYSFLKRYGHDCAGAIVFLAAGETPDMKSQSPSEEIDLAEAISQLPSFPITGDEEGQLSVGGFQAKLLVTHRGDRLLRPQLNVPSTHIYKPDPERAAHQGLVVSEAIAMATLRESAVRTATTELIEVAGRPVLVVTRFDRQLDSGGVMKRVHQEHLCQAMGLAPSNKYQRSNGPSYQQLAETLVSHSDDPETDLLQLLRQVTATVAVGNSDAHGCNYGLLIRDGALQLSPAYDVANTTAFLPKPETGGHRVAMEIGGKDRLFYVGRESLLAEARTWGIPKRQAEETIDETAQLMADALPGVVSQFDQWLGYGHVAEAVDYMQRHINRVRSA